jgi:uncharacterized protein
MKVSKYNLFFDGENCLKLAYNAMRGALLPLTQDQYEMVQRILANPDEHPQEVEVDRRLRSILCKGGFLIEDGQNELRLLKYLDSVKRFNSSTFNLCILPTTRCNFQCAYCYQSLHEYVNKLDDAEIRMGDRIREALIKFVKKNSPHLQVLNTRWYGGEPLLASNFILKLGAEIKTICDANGCLYAADMVTNGYLLSRKISDELRAINVSRLEISLDGPPAIHDRRRPLRSGGGTFAVILENLCYAAQVFPTVVVRLNLDQNNIESAPDLFDILASHKLHDKITIKFSNVEGTDDMARLGICKQSYEEFSKNIIQLTRAASARGFDVERAPIPNPVKCPATLSNFFIVEPNGALHKCFQEIGDQADAVGYIGDDGNFRLNYRITEWLGWDLFEHDDCINCDLLPICMGGCPYNEVMLRMKSSNNMPFLRSERCIRWKYNLKEMLTQLVSQQLNF